MKSFLNYIFNGKKIPGDVKLLTWATTVRWIGWGVVEALVPIFLLSFAKSYAETGLLSSMYDIAFIISLPFVGLLADKISSRTILILGMILCIPSSASDIFMRDLPDSQFS